MYAHDCIVRAALDVPILNGNMVEGARNVVSLPETPVEEFRVLLEYMYTQEVPAATMRKYAVGLLALSNQYLDPSLFNKCESYLCYKVHVRSPFASHHPAHTFTSRHFAHAFPDRSTRRPHRWTPTSSPSSPPPTSTMPSCSSGRASRRCLITASICSRTRHSSPSIPGSWSNCCATSRSSARHTFRSPCPRPRQR